MKNNASRIIDISYIMFQFLLILILCLGKHFDYASEALAILVSYFVFIFYEKINRIQVENYIRVMFILTLIGNDIFGYYLKLYDTQCNFDKGLHFFGTFTFALFSYSLLSKTLKRINIPMVIELILIITLGITLGTIFEIIEFGADTIFKTYCQKGLLDTDLDMVFNIIGACCAAIFRFACHKQNVLEFRNSNTFTA
jgi:uncharacterized membrane protein YjdF